MSWMANAEWPAEWESSAELLVKQLGSFYFFRGVPTFDAQELCGNIFGYSCTMFFQLE